MPLPRTSLKADWANNCYPWLRKMTKAAVGNFAGTRQGSKSIGKSLFPPLFFMGKKGGENYGAVSTASSSSGHVHHLDHQTSPRQFSPTLQASTLQIIRALEKKAEGQNLKWLSVSTGSLDFGMKQPPPLSIKTGPRLWRIKKLTQETARWNGPLQRKRKIMPINMSGLRKQWVSEDS